MILWHYGYHLSSPTEFSVGQRVNLCHWLDGDVYSFVTGTIVAMVLDVDYEVDAVLVLWDSDYVELDDVDHRRIIGAFKKRGLSDMPGMV